VIWQLFYSRRRPAPLKGATWVKFGEVGTEHTELANVELADELVRAEAAKRLLEFRVKHQVAVRATSAGGEMYSGKNYEYQLRYVEAPSSTSGRPLEEP
jgi:hypothetical protein